MGSRNSAALEVLFSERSGDLYHGIADEVSVLTPGKITLRRCASHLTRRSAAVHYSVVCLIVCNTTLARQVVTGVRGNYRGVQLGLKNQDDSAILASDVAVADDRCSPFPASVVAIFDDRCSGPNPCELPRSSLSLQTLLAEIKIHLKQSLTWVINDPCSGRALSSISPA